MEPTTELIAKIAKYVAYGIGVTMIVTKVVIHITNEDYSDLPFIGDML